MICGMTYYQICWYFLIYSFGGWVVEVIFHAVALGKVVNRSTRCFCYDKYTAKQWLSDE